MKKILLDTDIGCDIDDALTLTYLLKNPECELLGITTVSGDVGLRARLCSMICKHENKNIPIYTGLEKSVMNIREAEFPQESERLAKWPYDTNFPNQATEFLRDTIEQNPGQITLLAVGPLTNIADLFTKYPHTAPLLKDLYIMGGKFLGEEQLEWNIKFDPHAAETVFSADVKKLVAAGLDVTLSFSLFREQMAEKVTNAPIIKQFAEDWFNDISDRIYFHDPLATALVFDESICTYQCGTIKMNMQTYCTTFTPGQGTHRITDKVDVEKFYNSFFKILNS
ncbi:MAG: nucleoside hydrolase [Clostridiales bacterium]|nr:MAG: nucleoside hydrolase [Clostridiales bacterium]